MSSATTPPPMSYAEEAAHYGITRVMVDRFDFGGYRYTNLKDAIAEAKRRAPKPGAS